MKQKNKKVDLQVCCFVLQVLLYLEMYYQEKESEELVLEIKIKKGKGIVRAGYENKKDFNAASSFEIQKYYDNEPKFNGVFSRDNLPKKVKDGAYIIKLDEYKDVGAHWIALFVKKNEIVYFDSFGVEHIPEEIKEFIGNKNIKANIFRVQANNSVMCGYFCIGFIDFMLADKKLIDFTTLFSPYDFDKNDKIILRYFKDG